MIRDIVVVIPGILGSVLQKDGADLWSPFNHALRSLAPELTASFDALRVEGDDSTADDLGDGIVATQVIEIPQVVAGMFKTEGFARMRDMFVSGLGLHCSTSASNPANYHEFPYDWRRDNRVTARLLKQFIEARLNIWREHSGASDAKVIFLVHSMGGLVARYYLEVLGGWPDCRALVTFGTPHRGSLQALNFLVNGYRQLRSEMTDLVDSFTSMYQLLPCYRVVTVAGVAHRVDQLPSLKNIDPKRAQDAFAFHEEIEKAVERNREDPAYFKGAYELLPIVGIEQPTLQSAIWDQASQLLSCSYDPPPGVHSALGGGDGTVPAISAVPIELHGLFRERRLGARHACLHANKDALNMVYDLVSRQQLQPSPVRGPQDVHLVPTRPMLSLELEDRYRVDETIELRVRSSGVPICGELAASLQRVETSSVVRKFDFKETQEGWVLVLPKLDPGVYRFAAHSNLFECDEPGSVVDLFEVSN